MEPGSMNHEEYVGQQKRSCEVNDDSPWVKLECARAKLMAGGIKPPVHSILNLGCRHGHALRTLIEAFPIARVVGVDVVPEFVERAQEWCEEVVVGDARSLPFEDREFDWVFSSHTLEHVPDLAQAVKEIHRVAAKGVFLVVPLETGEKASLNEGHHTHHERTEGWLEEFKAEGWTMLHVTATDNSDLVLVQGRILGEPT